LVSQPTSRSTPRFHTSRPHINHSMYNYGQLPFLVLKCSMFVSQKPAASQSHASCSARRTLKVAIGCKAFTINHLRTLCAKQIARNSQISFVVNHLRTLAKITGDAVPSPIHPPRSSNHNHCHTYKILDCKSNDCHTYENEGFTTPVFATHTNKWVGASRGLSNSLGARACLCSTLHQMASRMNSHPSCPTHSPLLPHRVILKADS